MKGVVEELGHGFERQDESAIFFVSWLSEVFGLYTSRSFSPLTFSLPLLRLEERQQLMPSKLFLRKQSVAYDFLLPHRHVVRF